MSDDHLPRSDISSPEDVKTPLSFKLMVVLTALYLGWRLVQGVAWLAERFL